MPDIVMPKLSDSMEQGTILSWLKAPGEEVEIGEELLEIETDKATVAYAAEAAGRLEILVEEGATVDAGEPIARVGAAPAVPVTDNRDGDGSGHRAPAPTPAATPLARRAAAVHDVALEAVRGSGPLGRITRSDVLGHAGLPAPEAPTPPSARVPDAAPAPAASAPENGSPAGRRQEPSRLQLLIARRMAEAKATIPHFQVQTEVVMDGAVALRAELKGLAAADEPVPSVNDLVLKAAAVALRDHPLANGSYRDDGFVLHEQINIGVAVATDDALVVPTVFDAAGQSLGQIARDTRRLAARVRSGEITPAELESGTFTVSNLGMFGMTAITPVINPPQAAILGVGALRETLARRDGAIVERTLATLTLSCDHRILYGADAARFLARIRDLLETPLTLAL